MNKTELAKGGKLKRYRNRVKQYKQNNFFQNIERKYYQQVCEEYTSKNQ